MDNSLFIDRVYEAAVLPELWSPLLDDLSRGHGFEGGVLFTISAMAQRGVCSPGVKDVFTAFLAQGWAAKSERALRTIAKRHAGFVRDEDLFTAAEIETDPLHADLLRPFGFGDVAGTVIDCPNGDRMVLSFERALARGRTPDDVMLAFDALRPDLARSSMISARIELETARAQVAALGAIGLPSAVLSMSGRVIAANGAFEQLSAQLEIRARDVLAPKDPGAASLFRDALAQAEALKRQAGRSIALPGAEGAPVGVLHLLPIRRNAHDIFPSAGWLAAVTPLGAAAFAPTSILGGLFDLTPAEARVAYAVVEGLTVNEIAAQRSLSAATVRNQLAAIFAKTGVSRQSELVLLCSGLCLPGA